MRIPTPFSWLAARVALQPRWLRWSSTASLVVSILIVLTGGVVRVTGSGLGCPTWPTCDGTSVILPVSDSVHVWIEQGNRLLTGLVVVVVGWVIVSARLQRPRDRAMTRLAWSQFWLVVANAVAGGITVLTGLNPWVVALHFVMAIGLLTTATLTWHRAHRQAAPAQEPSAPARRVAVALVITTAVLVIAGTLVSGSGPHSGDSAEVARMGFDWVAVTVVHATLGVAVLLLGIWQVLLLRGEAVALARRRALLFVAVVIAQAAIGAAQSLTGLPSLLVALHLLGSALVWVGALRVLLDTHPRLFRGTDRTASTPDGIGDGERSPQLIGRARATAAID